MRDSSPGDRRDDFGSAGGLGEGRLRLAGIGAWNLACRRTRFSAGDWLRSCEAGRVLLLALDGSRLRGGGPLDNCAAFAGEAALPLS